MSRIARIVIKGVAHHVVQRGNNREDVFFVADDYEAYLGMLQEQSRTYGLEVLAYCLMANHVHLIAVPRRADSLAKAVGRTDYLYTQYVNRRHGRSGHLWQNRFYSCALEEARLLPAVRYVEQNPARAGMAEAVVEYPWSSAGAHAGVKESDALLDLAKWKKLSSVRAWRRTLDRPLAKREVTQLQQCTQRGWPLAGDSALARMEKVLNRRLHPLPGGRPSGAKDRRPRKRRKAKGQNIGLSNRS